MWALGLNDIGVDVHSGGCLGAVIKVGDDFVLHLSAAGMLTWDCCLERKGESASWDVTDCFWAESVRIGLFFWSSFSHVLLSLPVNAGAEREFGS